MKHAPSARTKQLEKRRLKAATFFEEGRTQVWVATHFSVSRPAAWAWYWAWKEHGSEGMKSKGRSGAPTKLTEKQLNKVEDELLKGPVAHGYTTELWTLERIAKLIKKTTGATFHPGHVWRLLQDLGWSSQKPETRARERNEKKISQWIRRDFPRIQKKGSKPNPS
jgi:transposase